MKPRPLTVVLLLAAVLVTGYAAWRMRPAEQFVEFAGPPRASYTLDDFDVVFLDERGNESFSAHGPLLARDPVSGEITLDRPAFRVPTVKGEWLASAQDGWIDARGDVLRLTREVEVLGTPTSGEPPIRLSTELLTIHPETSRATSEAAVTVTHGGSILRGRGLDADLASRRIQLAEVRGRHVPIAR